MAESQAHISYRPLRTPRSAAIAGGLLVVYAFDPDLLVGSGIYVFGRAMIFKFNNVYAIRMAGMFMSVLGTI